MIYFDAAATVPPEQLLWEALSTQFSEPVGNASASHPMGKKAKEIIGITRNFFANHFHVPKEAILFCSGGTESINLALKGVMGKRGLLLISPLEHAAVMETAKYLELQGVDLDFLKLGENGQVDLDDLKDKLQSKPKLVSVQAVNSETGITQDLTSIGALIKKESPKTKFHVDGIQAFGKLELTLENIDLLSLSGHKFRALSGTGLLVLGSQISLISQNQGGGQEFGLRSGTENLSGIFSLIFAAEKALAQREEAFTKVSTFSGDLISSLEKKLDWVEAYNPESRSPYVVSLWLKGILGEIALNHLGEKGIIVSTGSACNARKKKLSPALAALGFSDQRIKESIRLSFHPDFLPDTVEEVSEVMAQTLTELKSLLS